MTNIIERNNEILTEVESFVSEEIRPHAGSFEEKEELPKSLIHKMAQRGYLAAPFPRSFGGLGLDPLNYGYFTKEIGKGCSSTRGLITVHTSLVGETLLRWGSEKQKNELIPQMAKGEKIGAFALTEPNIGTDAKNITTSYVLRGDKYIINGKKKWISFGDIADFFLIIASNEGKVSAFIVERNMGNIITKPIKGLLSGKASHIAEIEFNNVEIPKENILSKEGSGFSYIASTALDFGRYSIAWGGIGLAEEALESMVSYARRRNQFGQKIYQFQLIHGIIADAITQLHAGESLCEKAGILRNQGHIDSIMVTNIAKYFSSQIAMKIATDAVQVHGGNGCYNKFPVERLFREAKILEIIEGTSQIQQEMISAFGLKRYNKSKYIEI